MEHSDLSEVISLVRKLNSDDYKEHSLTSGYSIEDLFSELNYFFNKHQSDKEKKSQIIEHVLNLSTGDFSKSLDISENEDELDVISMGLNTLSEELKGSTISIKVFDDIFDSFKTPFFIVNTEDNTLIKYNKSTLPFFNYSSPNKYRIPVADILNDNLIEILSSLNWNESELQSIQRFFKNDMGRWVVHISKLDFKYYRHPSISVFINDVTDEFEKQKEINNIVVRTIIDTQEKERVRFAKDIHDSLGQQLSAINFFLESSINDKTISGKKREMLLLKSKETLKGVLEDIRNICFNLMPKTLENYGLVKAICDLCDKMEFSKMAEFKISISKRFPSHDNSFEVAVFRIIQEFINNAVRHGKAKQITIKLKENRNFISLILKDNGKGFDFKRIGDHTGMGFKNIQSRVKSYNGEITIKSAINKGTSFDIKIPSNFPSSLL